MPSRILIDNGHGKETPGKRSPDGRLREWEFTRRLARRLSAKLSAAGMDNKLIVSEDADITLRERVRRIASECTNGPCVALSLHVNASANGTFGSARGFSAWVRPDAEAPARNLAAEIAAKARKRGLEGNRRPGPRGYYEADFAILRCPCPAVLTENMFMDNIDDLSYLLGAEAIEELAEIHFQALVAHAFE